MTQVNYGKLLAWAGALLAFATCIGYAFAGDWKKCAYFFFAGCITVVQAL